MLLQRQENSIVDRPQNLLWSTYIRGHRIWVSLVLDFLVRRMTIQEILADYPQ
ncbi:MAG: DUF433 domain-containing protein [Myxacorys chilensis ATA2-1-KO14]|nr:DUF433 domain-containing protein [Myxacorys chilensis ATA2-1-KO14]